MTKIVPALVSTVSGQVVDSGGITWPYAVLRFFLHVPSGQKAVDLTNGQIIGAPVVTTADVNGNFSLSLDQNSSVVPGSQWKVTIFPFNLGVQGQTLNAFIVGASALNLSVLISSQLQPFNISSAGLLLPLSHNGKTGQASVNGNAYYDVVSPGLFVRDPAAGDFVKIGPAAPPPAPTLITYLDNSGTPIGGQTRIMTGFGALSNGLFSATFAKPYAGSAPSVFFGLIGAEAAGSAAVPTLWLFSATTSGFAIHASNTTSTDTVRWMSVGLDA